MLTDLTIQRPTMMVQIYTLAARALADEIKSLTIPSPEAMDITTTLRITMQYLEDLKSTLVIFPTIPGAMPAHA